MSRLSKPILGKQGSRSRVRGVSVPTTPHVLCLANPDGTVQVRGPLKNRKLCYSLLDGGRACLDEFYAKEDAKNGVQTVGTVSGSSTLPTTPTDAVVDEAMLLAEQEKIPKEDNRV